MRGLVLMARSLLTCVCIAMAFCLNAENGPRKENGLGLRRIGCEALSEGKSAEWHRELQERMHEFRDHKRRMDADRRREREERLVCDIGQTRENLERQRRELLERVTQSKRTAVGKMLDERDR